MTTSRGSVLFVGLTTVDIAYLVDKYPSEDTKAQAVDQFVGAGGPAANAAVTFAFLADQSPTLITALGRHHLTEIARSDLKHHRVQTLDATPSGTHQPPLSSIVVAKRSSSRTIVSLDASRIHADFDAAYVSTVEDKDMVLMDGHYGDLAVGIAHHARRLGVPVVLDAGRWKEVHSRLLPLVDFLICSSAFTPPKLSRSSVAEIFDFASSMGVRHAAVTGGPNAIQYMTGAERGRIDVAEVAALDTLGAGDILHGAFCHYLIKTGNFAEALSSASLVATASCRYFGPRQWMTRPTIDAAVEPE